MKMFARIVLVVMCLAGSLMAQAQNLVGQWQGTLAIQGKELRVVFVIAATGQGNTLGATMFSIDQGGQGINATAAVSGGNVKLAVAPAGISFDGKLSADGNSILGTFAQGPGSFPLTLERANKDSAWALPAPPKMMAADAPLRFEVATVKLSQPGQQGRGLTMRGREVITLNTPASFLIQFAYGLNDRQVIGLPSWAQSENYDIVGRPVAEGVPNDRQIRAMIGNLLEERLKLTFHREKRDLPAYALVIGSGSKLAANTSNPNGLPGLGFRGLGQLGVVNATMTDFTNMMQNAVLDRPIVDRTGLQGRFDFTLNWTPDESQFKGMGVQVPPPPADAKFPGLFTAIQEQLGLKLDSVTAPVEVIVVDKIEKPSDN